MPPLFSQPDSQGAINAPTPAEPGSLQQAIAATDPVLTPNQRLSRSLLERHANDQHQRGIRAWQTPAIYSLENWIKQCWQQLQDSNNQLGQALLLDSRQELQLWQHCLDQDNETQRWLQPAGAARQAQQALKTLQLWRQHPRSEQLQPYLDNDFALDRWHQSFLLRCQPLQAITVAEAVERLIQAFEQGVLPQQQRCWLQGFQDIPPLYQALLAAAFEQQQSLDALIETRSDVASSVSHCQRLPCDTLEHEVEQAAQWARQILQRVPGARIAIVDPELSSHRDLHERSFRQHLEPHRLFDLDPVEAPRFNISIGTPLALSPVIDTALLLLSLLYRPLQLDDLPTLLYSPFINSPEQELPLRVQLEQQLRRLGLAELSLNQVQQQLTRLLARETPQQPDQHSAPQPQANTDTVAGSTESPCTIAILLEQLSTLRHRSKRSPGQWGRWLVSTLNQLGWPGQRQTSSLEYQQISQWYELLAGLGRFDALLPELSFSDGLRLIRTESQSTVFQPQMPNATVQILGPLEAAGLHFSHLWLLGLSDERWPAPANLNPLLPTAYQQAMQMPHASAERELSFASQLTQLFSRSADHVVFSHPLKLDDQLLRPSALISGYAAISPADLALTDRLRFSPADRLIPASQQQQQAPLELIDTARAPVITESEQQQLRGGSAILTNQSLCPFSAFAIHRLGARPLETPQTGLSHADRGNLLHNVLEQVWGQINSQQQLLAMPPEVLTQLLIDAVSHAIEPFRHCTPGWMGDRFWQLEQQRLHILTERWLELERQRPPFKVAAVEKSLNTELLGMPMRLRIDRVDRLSDGSELLIDYKTGSPSVADWFGDRPRQPQLPLYNFATRNPVSALAFGQVNAAEVAFKGVFDEQNQSTPVDGIKPLSGYRNAPCQQWQQQTELWRQTLEQLMSDFLNGVACVSPLDPNVYRYSQLQPLNRYYDLDRLGSADYSNSDPSADHATRPNQSTAQEPRDA